MVGALARLPALNELTCPGSDELVVRLLEMAEEGRLPKLTKLTLEGEQWEPEEESEDEEDDEDDDSSDDEKERFICPEGFSLGALALLLLWLKREAKKASDGDESAMLWELSTYSIDVYSYAGTFEQECLDQLKAAREDM